MNELELLKSQLNEINTKRVKVQTLIEQAQRQCEEIEKKYNVSSLEELKVLMDKAQTEYQQEVQKAQEYIEETNKVLSTYQGIL